MPTMGRTTHPPPVGVEVAAGAVAVEVVPWTSKWLSMSPSAWASIQRPRWWSGCRLGWCGCVGLPPEPGYGADAAGAAGCSAPVARPTTITTAIAATKSETCEDCHPSPRPPRHDTGVGSTGTVAPALVAAAPVTPVSVAPVSVAPAAVSPGASAAISADPEAAPGVDPRVPGSDDDDPAGSGWGSAISAAVVVAFGRGRSVRGRDGTHLPRYAAHLSLGLLGSACQIRRGQGRQDRHDRRTHDRAGYADPRGCVRDDRGRTGTAHDGASPTKDWTGRRRLRRSGAGRRGGTHQLAAEGWTNGGLTTRIGQARPRTSTDTMSPSLTSAATRARPIPMRRVGENVPLVTSPTTHRPCRAPSCAVWVCPDPWPPIRAGDRRGPAARSARRTSRPQNAGFDQPTAHPSRA